MSVKVTPSTFTSGDPRLQFTVKDDRYGTPTETYWRGYRVAGNRESLLSASCGRVDSSLNIPDDALDHAINLLVTLRELRDNAGPSQARGHGVVESLRGTEDGIAIAEALERDYDDEDQAA